MVDHLNIDRVDAHIQKIGGQAYVFGLAWYAVLDSKAKDRWRYAKKFAQEREFDIFLAHRTQHAAGLLEEHQAGAFSAAAIVSAQLEEEAVLGFFTLDEGRYWVFAKSDGLIDGDGDAVFDDQDEALDHFYDLLDLGEFDRILSSQDLEDEAYEKTSVDALFSSRNTAFVFSTQNPVGDLFAIGLHYSRNLQSLAREKPRIALSLAGVALVSVLGLIVPKLLVEDVEPLIAAAPVVEVIPEDFVEPEETVVIVSRPYENKPSAQTFLRLCQDRMQSLLRTVEGWEMENIFCTDARANLTYRATDFATRGAMERRFQDSGMLISFGNRGDTTAVANTTGQADKRPDEALWHFDAVNSWAHDQALKLSVDMEVTEIRSRRSRSVADNEPNITRVELPSLEFTLKAQTTPKVWASLLTIPGTVIDSANWTIEDGWQIEGRIYADEINHI